MPIRMRSKAWRVIAAAAAAVAAGSRAQAIVYRSDETDATALSLANQPQFSGVGIVNGAAGGGTGALIAPDWILTARHVVVGGTTATFYIGPNAYTGTVYTDGSASAQTGSDLALIHLSTDVPGQYASIAPNATISETDRYVWKVGYGESGPVGGSLVYDWQVRAGTNVTNNTDISGGPGFGNWLNYNNANTSSNSTAFEATTGPGDSGGPMFMQYNNTWYITGVTYGAGSQGFVDTPTVENYSWLLSTVQSVDGANFSFTSHPAPTSLTWTSNFSDAGINDGSGTWDIQRPNFQDGTYNFQWDNSRGNDVIFGANNGAAGTVTIIPTNAKNGIAANGVGVHDITFNAASSGNYTIASSGGGILTFVTSAYSAGDPVITANVNATISAPITGSTATIIKTGPAVLIFSGSNSYTGTTVVSQGTLQLAAANSLPGYQNTGGATVANGAILAVQMGGTSDWTASQVASLNSDATFATGSFLGFNTDDGNATYSGTISGVQGIAKLGAFTMTLTSSSTYSGATSINSGSLALSGANNLLPTATTVDFTGNATFNLGGTTQTIGNLTVGSGMTGIITGGSLTLASASPSIGGNNAALDMSGLTSFTYNQPNQTLTFNAGASTGSCTVTLAQGTGGNTISGSGLYVGASGSATGNSTTLQLGQTNVVHVDTLQVGTYHANGTFDFAPGLNSPTLTLRGQAGGASRLGNLIVGYTTAGPISTVGAFDASAGSINAMVGNLIVAYYNPASGTATATGTFTMGSGTIDTTNLIVAQNQAAGAGSAGVSVGTFNQNAGTVIAGALELGNAVNAAQTSTSETAVYNLGTTASTGTLSATTIGAGALTSTTANTTASRIINWNNGTIQTYNNGAGTITNLTISGAGTASNGLVQINLASSGTHAFYADAGYTIAVQPTAVMSGAGSISTTGPGTVQIQGSNSYAGGTTIDDNTGDLNVSASGGLGSGTVTIGSGSGNTVTGTLQLSGNITLTNAVNFAQSRTVISAGGSADIDNLSGSNTIAGNLSINGSGGTGANILSDAGTLTLSGQLANGNGVTGTRAYIFSGAGAITVSGNIVNGSANGAVTMAGANILTLSGSNTYTGQTSVSTGTLKLSAASTNNIAKSAVVVVNSGATLDVTGLTSGTLVLSAASATGHTGGQVLGGSGTVTGSVAVSAGAILSAGSSASLGTGASNTVGTLSDSSALAWGSNGEYSEKINSATGTPGTNWDQIKMAALAVTATGADSNHEFYIAPVAALTNVTYGQTLTWVIGNISGGGATGSSGSSLPTGTNLLGSSVSAPFALDTSNFSASFSGGATAAKTNTAFTLELVTGTGITGENLDLQYTATPEPGTWLLIGVGSLPIRRRRRSTFRKSRS
jgi:fibronectin-binding autotransporter adhesin